VATVGRRLYLVIEAALTSFFAYLRGLPQGETLFLNAKKKSATSEAHELLEAPGEKVKLPAGRKRVAKRSFTNMQANIRPLSK
jgi:hypothetical protein